MWILLCIINSVYLNGDTLLFIDKDTTYWVLSQVERDTQGIRLQKKARVSDNHKYFYIYEEEYSAQNELIQTRITLYDQNRNVLCKETRRENRRLSFELSRIYDKTLILVDFDRVYRNPSLTVVTDKKKTVVIKPGEWRSLVDYQLSKNGRYLLMHTRRTRMGRVWDYVYFFDLEKKKDWEYLFPMCLVCKRKRLFLRVDDQGESEIIYKAEHRIFSQEGELIHFFFKTE